jgi:tetratricopeptide (TPR) repeat protein
LGATALTGDGLVLGTPAYMAPEQHYGEGTDARTDQYAFCVALWEALYGVRPFTGKSASELAEAKRERRLSRPDTGARVSAALHRAILRGLHPDPQHRFAAMEPLLAVIDRAASPRAPRLVLVGLGAVALAGAFVVGGRGSQPSACEAAEERVRGVWNPARRSATAAAFEATGLPYAGDTWTRVEPALERWADTWATTHGEVCIASRDGPQSQAELDARMRCLDGALARFDGVLDAFEHADRDVAVAAAMSVRALPAASACASRPATESERLPDDPARARRVAELVARLRRHTGAAGAGALAEAVTDAERLLAEATAVGWDPLTAEVERAVGQAYERAARFDAATEHMQAALHLASAAGDDRVAAEAATDLVWLAGRHLSDVETAERWLPHAVAAVERLGDRPLHVAKLLNAQGLLAGLAGRVDEACTHYEEAHRLYAQELGSEHPDTLTAITNLGAMEMQRGAYARARDLHASVLRSLEGIYGPLHPEIAIALINLANARTRLGELADATDDIERAIRIRRDALGEEHPEVATALNNLGAIQEARGMYEDAERTHRAALQIFKATLPADHPNIGASMTNVGSSLERQGKLDDAIVALENGRAILADALPAEHPYLAYADVSLGAALRGAGRLQDAQVALDRARAACDRGTIEPGLCALADFERARLSWDARPASRGDAHASAAAALQTLEETPFAVARQHLDEMRAWVSAHDSAG